VARRGTPEAIFSTHPRSFFACSLGVQTTPAQPSFSSNHARWRARSEKRSRALSCHSERSEGSQGTVRNGLPAYRESFQPLCDFRMTASSARFLGTPLPARNVEERMKVPATSVFRPTKSLYSCTTSTSPVTPEDAREGVSLWSHAETPTSAP
jgi:hypothetical protein